MENIREKAYTVDETSSAPCEIDHNPDMVFTTSKVFQLTIQKSTNTFFHLALEKRIRL